MLRSVNLSHLLTAEHNAATWVIFCRDELVVKLSSYHLPSSDILNEKDLAEYHSDVLQLFDLQAQPLPIFVIDLGAQSIHLEQHEFASLRQVMMHAETGAFDQIGRAWQLVHFYRTHRFCGRCGSSMTRVKWETAMHCHACAHRCYPRVSPCVIVAVYRDDEILLAMNARHVKTGMYSILAGFVESGESLEQAVAREVFEEVGVEVCDIEYQGSQPWPFPHALMMGYIAKWKSGELKPDQKEIVEANWFSVSNLPLIPPKFSIAGRLIEEVVSLTRSGNE